MMDISDWRIKIDEVDRKILRLLNERSQFSVEIGKIKMKRDLPIHIPEREKEIYAQVTSENPGPLSDASVKRVFERIIDESRKLEKDMCSKEKNVNHQRPKDIEGER